MKFYIRYEKMGGDWYYMIYRRRFPSDEFYERWNNSESVKVRLQELVDLT